MTPDVSGSWCPSARLHSHSVRPPAGPHPANAQTSFSFLDASSPRPSRSEQFATWRISLKRKIPREMSGVELAQYAKRRFPHINVVMVSGRSPPYIPQHASFLLKPYRPKELLEAVLL
jgi:hypothetical protein